MRYASSEKQVQKFCFISGVRVNEFGRKSPRRSGSPTARHWRMNGRLKGKAQLHAGLFLNRQLTTGN